MNWCMGLRTVLCKKDNEWNGICEEALNYCPKLKVVKKGNAVYVPAIVLDFWVP